MILSTERLERRTHFAASSLSATVATEYSAARQRKALLHADVAALKSVMRVDLKALKADARVDGASTPLTRRAALTIASGVAIFSATTAKFSNGSLASYAALRSATEAYDARPSKALAGRVRAAATKVDGIEVERSWAVSDMLAGSVVHMVDALDALRSADAEFAANAVATTHDLVTLTTAGENDLSIPGASSNSDGAGIDSSDSYTGGTNNAGTLASPAAPTSTGIVINAGVG